MHTWKRGTTGIALGIFAMNALTLSLARPAHSAKLNCSTRVLNTAATATCSGVGTWRLRLDCKAEPDAVTRWVVQKGGTTKIGDECTFKARKATVEFQ
jgi:hypothetical protein